MLFRFRKDPEARPSSVVIDHLGTIDEVATATLSAGGLLAVAAKSEPLLA
ncbi:hypothetical protein [Bradyrhizobium elkanii]|nr:hypothetical protein [Bradyrhizobium elkanii]